MRFIVFTIAMGQKVSKSMLVALQSCWHVVGARSSRWSMVSFCDKVGQHGLRYSKVNLAESSVLCLRTKGSSLRRATPPPGRWTTSSRRFLELDEALWKYLGMLPKSETKQAQVDGEAWPDGSGRSLGTGSWHQTDVLE